MRGKTYSGDRLLAVSPLTVDGFPMPWLRRPFFPEPLKCFGNCRDYEKKYAIKEAV